MNEALLVMKVLQMRPQVEFKNVISMAGILLFFKNYQMRVERIEIKEINSSFSSYITRDAKGKIATDVIFVILMVKEHLLQNA